MSATLNALVLLRKNRKITQRQLSESMKLSQREISFIETKRRKLTLDTIGVYLNSLNNRRKGSKSKLTEEEWNLFAMAFIEDTLNIFVDTISIDIGEDSDMSRAIEIPHLPTKKSTHLQQNELLENLKIFLNLSLLERGALKTIADSETLKNSLNSISKMSKQKLNLLSLFIEGLS